MPQPFRQYAALAALALNAFAAQAQTADEMSTTIQKKLAPLPLEERVLLCTSPRLQHWAGHYELLFDTLPRPFNPAATAALLRQYASTKILLTDDYADSAKLREFADNQQITLSATVALPREQTDTLLYQNAELSHQVADFLRQSSAPQSRLYLYMIAGLLTGIVATVIYRERKRRQKKAST